jgi:peptidyl-dipeptidase Dcp
MHKLLALITVSLTLAARLPAAEPSVSDAASSAPNPFSERSKLPYELPPFDAIKDSDFEPAFEAGMQEQRSQVDAIARNSESPTFENTLVTLERSGVMLDRVSKVFFNLDASNTDPQIERIKLKMAPRLAAHRDQIYLNPDLFARVETVWRNRAELNRDSEAIALAQRYHALFVRAGARLSTADQSGLRRMNEQIAELQTRFEDNERRGSNEAAVVVDDRAALDGLSAEQIGAAEQAAKTRGLQGKWLIELQNTTIQPVLAQLTNRALRERIFRASSGRAQGGDADNTTVIAELVKLRAERAVLLGYRNHAAYALEDEGAGTAEAVNKMLADLAKAATAKASAEAAGLQAVIDAQARAAHTATFKLQPWDWAYYQEAARTARFHLQDADVKPYFEIGRVLHDGVFYAAHELYGLTFKERTDLPRYHPDVKIYEVFDADGSPLALLLADLYAREPKRGGAWMDLFVDQPRLRATKPVVVINLNVPKPAEGQPTLLTFEEVTALFHEFGHALHGMMSNVTYPLLSMLSLPPDFVEYPSQFNEMWAREPVVLAHYARHYRTGEPMPLALLDKVLASRKFGQGYATTEYLEAALLDQAWYQITADQAPPPSAVMRFEKAALQRARVDLPQVPPRYHSAYFLHIFTDRGYDAGYYGYIWAEVLARDTGQWFHRHGGLDRANGDFYREKVLSRGRTAEPKELFERFYGAPAEIGPLLEYHGLLPSRGDTSSR